MKDVKIEAGTFIVNNGDFFKFDENSNLEEMRESFVNDGFNLIEYENFLINTAISTLFNMEFQKHAQRLEEEGLIKREEGKSYNIKTLDKSFETWQNIIEVEFGKEKLKEVMEEVQKRFNKIKFDKKE